MKLFNLGGGAEAVYAVGHGRGGGVGDMLEGQDFPLKLGGVLGCWGGYVW